EVILTHVPIQGESIDVFVGGKLQPDSAYKVEAITSGNFVGQKKVVFTTPVTGVVEVKYRTSTNVPFTDTVSATNQTEVVLERTPIGAVQVIVNDVLVSSAQYTLATEQGGPNDGKSKVVFKTPQSGTIEVVYDAKGKFLDNFLFDVNGLATVNADL